LLFVAEKRTRREAFFRRRKGRTAYETERKGRVPLNSRKNEPLRGGGGEKEANQIQDPQKDDVCRLKGHLSYGGGEALRIIKNRIRSAILGKRPGCLADKERGSFAIIETRDWEKKRDNLAITSEEKKKEDRGARA